MLGMRVVVARVVMANPSSNNVDEIGQLLADVGLAVYGHLVVPDTHEGAPCKHTAIERLLHNILPTKLERAVTRHVVVWSVDLDKGDGFAVLEYGGIHGYSSAEGGEFIHHLQVLALVLGIYSGGARHLESV